MKRHTLTTMRKACGCPRSRRTSIDKLLNKPNKMKVRPSGQWLSLILRRLRPVFFILISGATSCQSKIEKHSETRPPSTKSVKKPAPTNQLSIGDTIEIFVMEDSVFGGIYRIRENGDIIMPKMGRIVVAGLTVEEAQTRIRDTLQKSQLLSATVIVDRIHKVESQQSFEDKAKLLVFITGKVNRPGQHMIAISDQDTVCAYEAILIAGGVAPFADEKKAYILRRGVEGTRKKIPIDLRAIRQGAANDMPLSEGDMICVPERRFAL